MKWNEARTTGKTRRGTSDESNGQAGRVCIGIGMGKMGTAWHIRRSAHISDSMYIRLYTRKISGMRVKGFGGHNNRH